MLPNMDVTNAAGLGGATPTPAKRQETDQLVQEAYRNLQNLREQSPAPQPKDDVPASASTSDAVTDAKATESTQQVARTPRSGTTRIYERTGQRDSAEINFQMTLEEREVFLNAMSGKEDPADMTEDEQTTLQKVSERIEKLLEEAEGKSSDRVDRLDKAIKEWYNRLSNGKHKAPADLVRLIRLSAVGTGDLSKVD